MTKREEFGRLLRYAMPYKIRLAMGVVCLSVVGLSEGLIALMITPIFDRVLNPTAPDSRLLLIKNPLTHQAIYLNSFLPSRIHSVGTLFAIAILTVFIGKGLAEFLGNVLVQYAGIAGVTDLRNQVYAKVIRQPIGFFQDQQTGRLLSTVINDVERVRNAFSEHLALAFRHIFTLFFLLAVLLATSWKMTLGSIVLLPIVVWPVRTLGQTHPALHGENSGGDWRAVADFGRNGQRQSGREGFRDGGFRDRKVSRLGGHDCCARTCAGSRAQWPPPRSWICWARS